MTHLFCDGSVAHTSTPTDKGWSEALTPDTCNRQQPVLLNDQWASNYTSKNSIKSTGCVTCMAGHEKNFLLTSMSRLLLVLELFGCPTTPKQKSLVFFLYDLVRFRALIESMENPWKVVKLCYELTTYASRKEGPCFSGRQAPQQCLDKKVSR